MDDIKRIDLVDIELTGGSLHRSWCKHSIGSADALANAFGVRVFRDGEPVNLGGGSVQGFFRDPQGNNIALTTGNTVSDNVAYVVLPATCYNYEGQFCLAIKVKNTDAGITGTMRIVDGMVDNTHTDNPVVPTESVPDYTDVLAVYEEMLEAKAGSVRFDITQSLTAAQKAQARENIGAPPETVVRYDVSQNMSETQKARARRNIRAGSIAEKDIYNAYAQTFLTDLDDADENTTYVVQRTANTTTTHFPSDFPTDGSVSTLQTYSVKYSTVGDVQMFQILTRIASGEVWRRNYINAAWSSWVKSEPVLPARYSQVYPNDIYDSYAQTFITDLNSAQDNTTYVVQRTPNTTTLNFPSDFPADGSVSLLKTYRAVYNAQGDYMKFQILRKIATDESWRRSWSFITSSWGAWAKSASPNEPGAVYTIGEGQTYTTIRAGIAAALARPNSTVYVLPGTYDLVTEFADAISSSMGAIGNGLGNGMHVIFYDGAKVTANFDSSDYDSATWRKIYDNFNPFYAAGGDFIIEGLDIEATDTRYCVHDEMSGNGTYVHKYFNCRMKYTNTHSDINYVQCIGGGLGEHGTIVIDGGYFETETDYGVPSTGGGDPDNAQMCVSFHNGNNAGADSSITIKNVYLANRGFFRFGYYGPSDIESMICISGCSTGLPTLVKAETQSSTHVNFALTEWGETLRNPSHWTLSDDGYTATLVDDD